MLCHVCGKEFHQVKVGQEVCSHKCYMRAYEKKRREENPDYRKGMKADKICRHCGKAFSTTNAKKSFCSPECKIGFHNANRQKSEPYEATCSHCGVSFHCDGKSGVGKLYCSKLCAGRARKSKHHPLRRMFDDMWSRCTNPESTSYQRYGAIGVSVCERWKIFENFLADMGEKPSPKHSIDRIDNDKGYEPGNCRWATKKEQARNRRNTIDQNVANTVRELHKLGKSNKEISRLMAIPYHVVYAITSGKSWAD